MSEEGEEIGRMIDHPNFICQKCGKIHRKVKTEEARFKPLLIWKCDLCGHPHEIKEIGEAEEDG